MKNPVTRLMLFVTGLVWVAEMFIWISYARTGRVDSVREGVILHVLISGVQLAFITVLTRRSRADRHSYLLLGLMNFFLPVIGSFLTAVIVAQDLMGRAPPNIDEDDEWEPVVELLHRHLPTASPEECCERIAQETNIMPLAEIMTGTDIALIRGAVDKLSQLRTPEAIRILMEQRRSPIAEVRFFVTSALTRIKNEFDEELESAKRHLKNESYKISARFFLAKQYFNYALSGLLDDRMANSYFHEALEHMNIVIRSHHASVEAAWFMVGLLKRLGRHAEALTLLDDHFLLRSDEIAKRLKARADILYETRRFHELREVLAELRPLKPTGQEAMNSAVFDWWGGA